MKVPADAGIWYIRWEEGHQPKWRRCESMSDAIQQQFRKRIELQAVSIGIDINATNPSRLRLTDAIQQYIGDQKPSAA